MCWSSSARVRLCACVCPLLFFNFFILRLSENQRGQNERAGSCSLLHLLRFLNGTVWTLGFEKFHSFKLWALWRLRICRQAHYLWPDPHCSNDPLHSCLFVLLTMNGMFGRDLTVSKSHGICLRFRGITRIKTKTNDSERTWRRRFSNNSCTWNITVCSCTHFCAYVTFLLSSFLDTRKPKCFHMSDSNMAGLFTISKTKWGSPSPVPTVASGSAISAPLVSDGHTTAQGTPTFWGATVKLMIPLHL